MSTAEGEHAASLSRRTLWVAYAIGAFGLGLNTQATFLVPLRARELGASFEIIGLIVGAGALVPALFSVPLGRVIDRLGPRRSYLLGTGSSSVMAVLLIGANSYWALLGFHVMLGIPRTLGWIASQNYITGLGEPRNRAAYAGRFSLFTNVGTLLGPLLAGAVAQVLGFRLAFGLLAAYAAFFTLIGVLLPEAPLTSSPVPGSGQGAGFGTARQLTRIRGIQVALILTFVRLWNEYVWTAFFPVYLVDRGMDAALVGTVVSTKGLMATILGPTVGFWCRFMTKEHVAIIGLGCGALGLLISPHVAVLPFVYLAPVLLGIGGGVSLPMLLNIVSEAAPEHQRGVALGLRMSVNQMAGGVAPLLVGPLVAGFGTVIGFGMGGLVAAGLLFGARALHRSERRHAGTGPWQEGPSLRRK